MAIAPIRFSMPSVTNDQRHEKADATSAERKRPLKPPITVPVT